MDRWSRQAYSDVHIKCTLILVPLVYPYFHIFMWVICPLSLFCTQFNLCHIPIKISLKSSSPKFSLALLGGGGGGGVEGDFGGRILRKGG